MLPASSSSNRPYQRIQELFLPPGYPHSVSPDYLAFQLWSVPTHVTGWMSLSLSTSSLLKAVSSNMTSGGEEPGAAVTAVGGGIVLAASAKWLLKDGIGSLGRILVSSLGPELDDDPRRWRMIAEILASVGIGLEVSTSIFPWLFLPLAALGNFLKAIGKGVSKPAFRVIQGHLARANNVGAVSAKEEVWEVLGQTLGLLSAVLVINSFEGREGSVESVALIWVVMQLSHVFFRRHALGLLSFRTLNRKRACHLIRLHVSGQKIEGVEEVNRSELLWENGEDVRPSLKLGATMEEVLSALKPTSSKAERVEKGSGWREIPIDLEPYVEMFQDEGYLLSIKSRQLKHQALAVLKSSSAPGEEMTYLKAIYLAAWIDFHWQPLEDGPCPLEVMKRGLDATRVGFPLFLEEAEAMDWEVKTTTLGLRNPKPVELN
jgi:hypothetical protein